MHSKIEKEFLALIKPYAKSDDNGEFNLCADYILHAFHLAVEEFAIKENRNDAFKTLFTELENIRNIGQKEPMIKEPGLVFEADNGFFSINALRFGTADTNAIKELFAEAHNQTLNNPYYQTLEGEENIQLKRHENKFQFSFLHEETRDEFAEELNEKSMLKRDIVPHMHYSTQMPPHEEYFITIPPRDIHNMLSFQNFLTAEYDFDLKETINFLNAKPDKGISF